MSVPGIIVGGLLITFLVSRIALMLMRSRPSGAIARLVLAHLISFALIAVAAGFGFADGGGFDGSMAAIFVVPQAFWLIFDLIRLRLRSKRQSQPGY